MTQMTPIDSDYDLVSLTAATTNAVVGELDVLPATACSVGQARGGTWDTPPTTNHGVGSEG